MSRLVHIIYSSASSTDSSPQELLELLEHSRFNNTRRNITGMLVHIDGSFLQVLEGAVEDIDALFSKISADARHTNLVTIIREAIAQRAFSDWSMGFADINIDDIDNINAHEGLNDFFENGTALRSLAPGRAKKLLSAFKDGRWRSRRRRRSGSGRPSSKSSNPSPAIHEVEVAFQPIISLSRRAVWSYEAFVWDIKTHDTLSVNDHAPEDVARFEERARQQAMAASATPGAQLGISINVRPRTREEATTIVRAIIDQANSEAIDGRSITVELNQDCLDGNSEAVTQLVQDCKASGLTVCLDDFGAGRSGLRQIELSEPNSIALNEKLVRGIDSDGAKQAILGGLLQTCEDLAIDVVAKHVQTDGEFRWLADAGVDLFQGRLFRSPALATMPADFRLPELT